MLTTRVSRTVRAAIVLLGPALVARASFAEAPYVERYVAAVRLARAGRADAALERLAELARTNPSAVPIHRALAELAVSTGRADVWSERFGTRLRRAPRDIGAAVGLAVLESARSRPAEASRLLLNAVAAGARDSLLAPLLVRNASADELAGWFAARASVLPRDSRFAALRTEVLLALDRAGEARVVLERALAQDPRHADLLALHAGVLRAAGETDRACEEASAAARQWAGDQRVPEARAPVRFELARVWIACGQTDQAQRALATAGPLITAPGGPPLLAMASVVEAELALAREDPLSALALLQDKAAPAEADPAWDEAALAIRTRAAARLGFESFSAVDIARLPLPAGLAVADRSAALAACASADDRDTTAFPAALEAVAARLAAQGLATRAARLRALDRFLAAAASGAAPESAAPDDAPREAGAELRAAAALTEARRRSARGDARGALEAASPAPQALEGAPGALRATLGIIAARTALDLGEPQRAAVAARESLLDIEGWRQARGALAPEIEPLVGSTTENTLELSGLALRAAIAGGRSPVQAADELLRNLGRVARGWSVVAAPWPVDVEDLAEMIPADSCLVITTCGEAAPALALDRRRGFTVAAAADVASTPLCARKRRLLWAGPGAPRGGLSVGDGDSRLLVRAVVPFPAGERAAAEKAALATVDVGPGPDRPLRALVERLAAQPTIPTEGWASRFDAAREWPVFHGAGLLSATAPLSAGWLVAPGLWTPSGWVGPETLQTMPATPRAGLVALGLASPPGDAALEGGARVLAEAALSSGWSWALFSRRPLTPDERRAVESRLGEWAADPLRAAERLVRKEPALSAALMLWTRPEAPPTETRRYYTIVLIAAAGALLLAGLAARRIVKRRRQPRTSSRLSAPPPDAD